MSVHERTVEDFDRALLGAKNMVNPLDGMSTQDSLAVWLPVIASALVGIEAQLAFANEKKWGSQP